MIFELPFYNDLHSQKNGTRNPNKVQDRRCFCRRRRRWWKLHPRRERPHEIGQEACLEEEFRLHADTRIFLHSSGDLGRNFTVSLTETGPMPYGRCLANKSRVSTPSLLNGGPAGVFWGYILIWIGSISIYTVLSELASMAPTAGGQYQYVLMYRA
jgi:hypothetical protein